jgi:carboxyl-terminal processing protease
MVIMLRICDNIKIFKIYYRFIKSLLMPFAFIILIQACTKVDINDSYLVNREIYNLMQDLYLWYEYLPDVDVGSFDNPYELMDYLRHDPPDQWSVVLPKEEYNRYFEEGEMIGHGILLGEDSTGRIRICFVYRSTQAFEEGVRRSWIVDSINDVAVTRDNFSELIGPKEIGIRNKFTFINADGEPVTLYLVKELLDITPVLYYDIIHANNKLFGYMVFQDFIETAISEIDDAFTEFKNNSIDELIIDLRYNSGGSLSVAEYLAGWIAGSSNSDKAFIKLLYNNKHHELDTVVNVPFKENGLYLERIFFIGTNSTASASELLINGLSPFMGVSLIGDNTYGKPVGMLAIPFINYDYVVLPVCFRFTNANDEGDFYDGLVPDSYSDDDITRDFGDPEEDCLEETLNYMETGIPSALHLKSTGRTNLLEPVRPINKFLKAY